MTSGPIFSSHSYQICHHRCFDFMKLIIILKVCENTNELAKQNFATMGDITMAKCIKN